MGACESCSMFFKSEAERLIHADNWPEHKVVAINEEPVPHDDDFGIHF